MADYESRSGGALMGGLALLRSLHDRKLLVWGTWAKENVKAAKYNLRLSDRLLIVRNPGESRPLYVGPGERHTRHITIRPGGVALVSTMERLRLPPDVAANIGNKFEYIIKGALMLNGLHVDPGYGYDTPDGKPLFFMLANTSLQPIRIKPGKEVIGILQFISVTESLPDESDDATARADYVMEEYFSSESPPELSLSLFEAVEDIRTSHKELKTRFEEVEKGTKEFGVFLIAATALVGLTIALLDFVRSSGGKETFAWLVNTLPRDWPRALVLLAFTVFLTVLWFSGFRALSAMFRGLVEGAKRIWRSLGSRA